MQKQQGKILFSATDLIDFLECDHLTSLDLNHLETPRVKTRSDEQTRLIREKGFQYEKTFLHRLKKSGLKIADLGEIQGNESEKILETIKAMSAGADIIHQATFQTGQWTGQADFLKRVKERTSLGDHGYEVIDTKLSLLPKARFIIQICFYSDLLSGAQGHEPGMMTLVLGDGTEQNFRVADFSRYYRFVKTKFLEAVMNGSMKTSPERSEHCALCHWRDLCEARWVEEDHLNQVANITRVQIKKLRGIGIRSMEQLAKGEERVKVPKMAVEIYQKLHLQAELQLKKRHSGKDQIQLLPADPEGKRGFYRLPAPEEGDLFFDMEGDPLETDGLEYLFGIYTLEKGAPLYKEFWGHNRHEERGAFESFIDFVMERLRKYPHLHIYHYASYEESALKRLMSYHGTRESEVDHLLRGRRLIDLYKVVREGLMVSEPAYSLKNIEKYYMEKREGEVKDAGASIVCYERWKETQEPELLEKIRRYNQIDCHSLYLLRGWLIELRLREMKWFDPESEHEQPAENESVKASEKRMAAYESALLSGLPEKRSEWTSGHHLRQLVFYLLDYYRREAKPAWWKQFSRQEMTDDELMEDPECIGGMRRDPGNPPFMEKKSMVYTYRFPDQEIKMKAGARCYRSDTLEPLGTLLELDEEKRIARLKVSAAKANIPESLSIVPEGPMKTEVLQEAIFRFAGGFLENNGKYQALLSFLSKKPPLIQGHAEGEPVIDDEEEMIPQAIEAAAGLKESYLFIQGPPGSGKTYTGSHIIVELLRRGYKVGISSNSHKAINHLLRGVENRAEKLNLKFKGFKKSTQNEPETWIDGKMIQDRFDNDNMFIGKPDLVAGTAWFFARPELDQTLDFLFVDEAGQVSLANLVAIGTSAKNLVLLGDQMQLGQPTRGVHPDRSGESSLDYLLDGASTIPPDRGIFLKTTYRMHESVCRFISDVIYDGRLHPESGNQKQTLLLLPDAEPELRSAGIRFIPLPHEGCSQKSQEEADKIRALYLSLLEQSYTDYQGKKHPMTPENIMVVAPYNLQINLLKQTLPPGARVGTVDRFQGQEAEVVMISMTTSSGEELPRQMEFLYSKNRLNVALSRAKILALLVANPSLMSVKCQTVEQMALVNTLCWVKEYSDRI